MTPSARVAAAIEILDVMAGGLAAEQALTRWARQSRYAGSKDRAAVRDHVFDVLRQYQTASLLGGGTSGRALMVGVLRAQDVDPHSHFTGEGHAPAPLTPQETENLPPKEHGVALLNLPSWLEPELDRSLGDKATQYAKAIQARAPISLRVNLAKKTRDEVVALLEGEGVETQTNALSPSALSVLEGARRLRGSATFAQGLFDFQDASSQAVIDILPKGQKCLDFCAGGGGKALALAAQTGRRVFAHDIDPNRMKDIAPRALRAGCDITQIASEGLENEMPFDLVLCDAPCSGSGAWRRSPEAKWTLTQTKLDALCEVQDSILAQAAELINDGGTISYATCSVLQCENEDRIAAFLASHAEWHCIFQRRFDVTDAGDGFFTAHLTRL